MQLTRRPQRGFSIIELSIALTIAGLLLALGAPSISGYLQNARLGSLAKSIYTGLQLARTEAVKQNQRVEFVLTSSSLESSTADSVALDTTGRNWVVRQRPPGGGAYSLIEQKVTNGGDGGGVTVGATAAAFEFNSLGGVTTPGTIEVKNPSIGACSPGPARCWNVVVSAGGQIRLCSPDPGFAATDSRHC